MTTHPKPFVFFGSLLLYLKFFLPVCLFACFQCLCERFIRQAPDYPWTLPKKLSKDKDACVRARSVWSAHKKAFYLNSCVCFCHHKFFLVCFLSMTERVSDWRLWDNRERGSDRDEPGYEEDIDSAQANTNHIMHNQQTINLKLDRLVYQVNSWSIPCKTLWKS